MPKKRYNAEEIIHKLREAAPTFSGIAQELRNSRGEWPVQRLKAREKLL